MQFLPSQHVIDNNNFLNQEQVVSYLAHWGGEQNPDLLWEDIKKC